MVADHTGYAAIAADHSNFTFNRNTVIFQRTGKSQNIGVIADGLAVMEMDRVDTAQITGGFIYCIQIIKYSLFVRNGQIQTTALAAGNFHGFFQFLRRNIYSKIGAVLMGFCKQLGMQLR